MSHSVLTTSKLIELPVHDYDLEIKLLKAVLFSKDNLKYFDILVEDDFYNNDYKKLFIALKNLYVSGKAIDFDLIPSSIKSMDSFSTLITAGTLFNFEINEYISRLKRIKEQRELQRLAFDMTVKAKEDIDPFEIIQYVSDKIDKHKVQPEEDIISQNIRINNELLEELQTDKFYGVRTGFKTLDYMIRGFANSTLSVLGGLPSSGKTTFVINMILNMCREGSRVLFVNMEMNYVSLRMKIVSLITGIPTSIIYAQKKNITDYQWGLIIKALGETANFRLYSIGEKETSFLTIEKEIEAHGGFDIVIIDYLQLLQPDSGNTRYEEVMAISRNLKRLTTKYNMPVLAISSMTEKEGSSLKSPKLNSLRDAHTIGYDADVVLFLLREAGHTAYNEQQFVGTQEEYEHHAELLVAKNRWGISNKRIDLYFDGATSVFKEVSEYKGAY